MKQDIDIIDIEALKADEPVSGVACTWHDHIADITSKTWKRINVFWSLMFKLDRKTLETIYFSFIRPTLEYSDVVWDNCNCDEKYRIEQIQIEAALIVTGATRSCSRSKLLEDTGWISLEKRRYNHRLLTFFKMLKKDVPLYLKDLVPPTVHQVSQRNLRSGGNIQPARCNTSLYQNSFLIKTIKDWNILPENIKLCNSDAQFKRYLNKDNKVVPTYFYVGERRSQILHTRLRLGCSLLNSDLYKNHLRDNDKCICGAPETAEHFLFECNIYAHQRNTTIYQIPFQINTIILLSGCPLYDDAANVEIFKIVQRFIIESGRFD